MKSIRCNLVWAAASVLAAGVLVLAFVYLYSRISRDRQITAHLKRATDRLEQLATRDPHPNAENLKAAKLEEQRLQSFVADLKPHFGANAPVQINSNRDFRAYLDTSIARLRSEAQRSGVEVPSDYWFTFAAQKGAMSFSEKSLGPLALQMAEITTLCEALFSAKVNALAWLKRPPVDTHDTLGSQDYLNAQPSTNKWAIIMPYEIAFQGFSSELAAVLDRLTRLPQCFIVKNLSVEPAGSSGGVPELPRMLPPAQDGQRLSPGLFRGNLDMDRIRRPQSIWIAPRSSTTVLAEQPLRFVLSVQAVRAL